jgi:hypothetical protein
MDRIFGSRDGGGGRRGDWKSVLAEKAAESLPTILESLGDTSRRRAAAPQRPQVNSQEPVRPPVAPNPAQRVPSSNSGQPAPVNRVAHAGQAQGTMPPPAAGFRIVPAAEEFSTVAESSPNATASEETANAQATVEIMPTEQEIYVTGVKRRVVACVQNGDEGAMIVDFLEIAWPEAVNYLEAFNAEQITEFFGNDPILREAVAHPRWAKILQQAQEYLHEDLSAQPAAAN